MNDQIELNDQTIMCGVICNNCECVLKPHTIGNHLDKTFMVDFHVCGRDDLIPKRSITLECRCCGNLGYYEDIRDDYGASEPDFEYGTCGECDPPSDDEN